MLLAIRHKVIRNIFQSSILTEGGGAVALVSYFVQGYDKHFPTFRAVTLICV